ncbi:MAG: glycosyltransferase [Rhizobacter sp.]|nr:glycosyltransferase [Ferruginibacter sp.]
MILTLVTTFLLILYGILLVYYRVGWMQVPDFVLREQSPELFISVIIPARNEARSLPVLLDSLENQTYSKKYFQVLVIDDYSTDKTAAIASDYSFVTCLSLRDFVGTTDINSYKKKAIETGIENSVGELIVTTDADCYAEPEWLETIAAFYNMHRPELIVMPVSVNCSARPIEIFQSLDFMSLQGITAAAVQKKVHSMCNGANLAYTRKAFEAVNGFKNIDNIASGDDMLLMHKIALQYPNGIHYLKSANVIIQTAPVHSIKEFFNQRIRWASKADKYDDKRIFAVLFLVYFLNVTLLIIPLLSIFSGGWSMIRYWLLLMAAKTIVELIFLFPVAGFFNKRPLLWAFPLAQPFHIIYTVIAGWLGKFGSYKWKERKVK